MTRAEEAAAFLADYEALCAVFDAQPIVLASDKRRLNLGKHPLHRLIQRLAHRVAVFCRTKVLVQGGGPQPIEGGERVRRIQQAVGDVGQQYLSECGDVDRVLPLDRHEGGEGVHPNLSCVSQPGEDAESPGRETDPAVKPEGRA